MVKRILVPTDGSDVAGVGARFAVALGARLGAKLLGLHVVDIKLLEGPFLRDISASLGTAPYVNYQGSIALILEERGKAALTAFRNWCDEAGVACETFQTTGIVARSIVERSELADLIVMGRSGEHSEWLDGLLGSTTETIARRARRPLLVTTTDTPGYQRLLLAYDGSANARAALRAAADIATHLDMACSVLVVDEHDGQRILEEARSYLDSHGREGQYLLRTGDPGETIMECATECGADLLVLGAYGHTKVRELVLGSTTAFALNHASCPVLLTR